MSTQLLKKMLQNFKENLDFKKIKSIDLVLDNDFYVFKDKNCYSPVYFFAKDDTNIIYAVFKTEGEPIVSELSPENIIIRNIKSIESEYKLALDKYLAKKKK